jgi:hypothetical protein
MKNLNEVIQELDATAVTGPPSCSLNQSQSLSNFTDMLNLLEEEPVNSKGLTDEPCPDEVARYLDPTTMRVCVNIREPQLFHWTNLTTDRKQ